MEVEIGWACPAWASPVSFSLLAFLRGYRGKRIPRRNCFVLRNIQSNSFPHLYSGEVGLMRVKKNYLIQKLVSFFISTNNILN